MTTRLRDTYEKLLKVVAENPTRIQGAIKDALIAGFGRSISVWSGWKGLLKSAGPRRTFVASRHAASSLGSQSHAELRARAFK